MLLKLTLILVAIIAVVAMVSALFSALKEFFKTLLKSAAGWAFALAIVAISLLWVSLDIKKNPTFYEKKIGIGPDSVPGKSLKKFASRWGINGDTTFKDGVRVGQGASPR